MVLMDEVLNIDVYYILYIILIIIIEIQRNKEK